LGAWDGQKIAEDSHAYNCSCIHELISAPQMKTQTEIFPAIHVSKGIQIGSLKIAEANNESLENWNETKGDVDANTLVLRLNEISGESREGTVEIMEMGIIDASWSDLLELPSGETMKLEKRGDFVSKIHASFAPNEIKTLLLIRKK
jgi:hypothetical protein